VARDGVGMKGFGQLENPRHLLAKLTHDYARMMAGPGDQYAAFDFFVTAEHMVDWVAPGYARQQERSTIRNANPLLQVVSNIASGSKHFIAEDARHHHVQHVDVAPSPVEPGDAMLVPASLYVTLEGDAAVRFGSEIAVMQLAEAVLSFWEKFVESNFPVGDRGGPTTGCS
jgi:hypothetical protein